MNSTTLLDLEKIRGMQSNAMDIDGTVKGIDTVADFATMKGRPNRVYVSGYHEKGDGAYGSHFFTLKEELLPDGSHANSGTIWESPEGVYELVFDAKFLLPEWFGAKPINLGLVNKSTSPHFDSFPALNAITIALKQSKYRGYSIWLSSGRYEISKGWDFQTVRWNDGGNLIGISDHSTEIYLTQDDTFVLRVATDSTNSDKLDSYVGHISGIKIIGRPNTDVIFDASKFASGQVIGVTATVDYNLGSHKEGGIGTWCGNWYTHFKNCRNRDVDIGFYVTSGKFFDGSVYRYGHGTQGVSFEGGGVTGANIGVMIPEIPESGLGITDSNQIYFGNGFVIERCKSAGAYITGGGIGKVTFSDVYFESNGGGSGVPIYTGYDDANGLPIEELHIGEICVNVPKNAVSKKGEITLKDSFISAAQNSQYLIVSNNVGEISIFRNKYTTKKDNGVLHLVGKTDDVVVDVVSYEYSDTGLVPDFPIKVDERCKNIKYVDKDSLIKCKYTDFAINDLRDPDLVTLEGMQTVEALRQKDGSYNFKSFLDSNSTTNQIWLELPLGIKGTFKISGYIYNGVAAEDKVAELWEDGVKVSEVNLSSTRNIITITGNATSSVRIKLGRNYTTTFFIRLFSFCPSFLEIPDYNFLR